MVNDDILIWWGTIQPFKIIYDKYQEITYKHTYKIILNKILQETEYMLREQLSYSGCLPSPVLLIGFNPSTQHPMRTKYPGLCYCKFLVFPLSLLLQKQSLLVLFVCLFVEPYWCLNLGFWVLQGGSQWNVSGRQKDF